MVSSNSNGVVAFRSLGSAARYPLGWGNPSRHREPASLPPHVELADMTRQQRRARQRAEIKAFNRKDSRGKYVSAIRRGF